MSDTHGLSFKRIAGYTAIVMATLALLFVLAKLGQVVLLFVLSIIVAAALRQGVLWLERRRVPRGIAILLWYLLIIGVIALGVWLLGTALGNEMQRLTDLLPQAYDRLLERYQHSQVAWQQAVAQRLPSTNTFLQSLGEGGASDVGFQIAGVAGSIVNVIISLVAILTLTFYWLADQERFERLWLMLLPAQERTVARHVWRNIEQRVGAYVRSEFVQLVLTIGCLWVAFSSIGTPFPTLYALYAGIVQLIPWIGIPLTLLPLAVMALNIPWWIALGTAAAIIVVGIVMDRVIEPRLCGTSPVHPILSVVALMLLGEASGVLGMLIALPLAATLQTVLSEIIIFTTSSKASATALGPEQIADIQARVERLREEIIHTENPREAEGLLARLQVLLDQTAEVVDTQSTTERARRRTTPGQHPPATAFPRF